MVPSCKAVLQIQSHANTHGPQPARKFLRSEKSTGIFANFRCSFAGTPHAASAATTGSSLLRRERAAESKMTTTMAVTRWLRGGLLFASLRFINQPRGRPAAWTGLGGQLVANISSQATIPHPASENSVLVRDFIRQALYDAKEGYFAARSEAVGDLQHPITFSRFEGQRAYRRYLADIYKQSRSSWFTPVEIFQPHYGDAIAEYILRTHNSAQPFQILEIGGGNGTCARNILDYMEVHAPRAVFDTMNYTSVEISETLAKKQYDNVTQAGSRRRQFRVECRDAGDRNGWGSVDRGVCVVIMLEVLDNLPHDLVHRKTRESPWMQMCVSEKDCSGVRIAPSELAVPVQDHLIQQCLDAENSGQREGRSLFKSIKDSVLKLMNVPELVWLPTGCLRLLETLHIVRPNMALIASDFSSLPDVKIAGEGAPLVASKSGGQTKDHTSYLEAKGQADIFFPTDFSLLRRLDLACAAARGVNTSRHTSILTTAEFMDIFADTDKTLTRDGYNPLLEDFNNTKFYLSTPRQRS